MQCNTGGLELAGYVQPTWQTDVDVGNMAWSWSKHYSLQHRQIWKGAEIIIDEKYESTCSGREMARVGTWLQAAL
jgi:hypothetical protein